MLEKEEIKEIALLARVGLRDEDIDKYQKDLSDLLDYFETLKEINTDNIEPIGHITGMKDVMRGDERGTRGDLAREDILKNAPKTKDDYFEVKSVL